MKKVISFILCVSLLASIVCIPVSATQDNIGTEKTAEFCDGINEMVNEYGDAAFITPVFDDEQESENTKEEIEIKYCSRLIVQSDKPIEKYDAVDVVSGFSNFYIVQFENEEDTNYAYEHYKNNPDILSVAYDVSYNALLEATGISDSTEEAMTYEDYKNAWYLDSTGMKYVLEKYKDADLPEVVIGVVDSGHDFNNTYFSDRIIKTGFNNAGDGDENSEQDYYGHGTKVTSLICNFTTDNVKIAHYRCTQENGALGSASLAAAAMLAAVDDGVDAINCSFYAFGADELFQEVIDYAYDNSCAIFNSSGSSFDLEIYSAHPLNISEKTVTVGASDKCDTSPSNYAWGEPVDVLAPGDEVPACGLDNVFHNAYGTSMSAAVMTGIYAMFYATHQGLSFAERMRAIKGCGNEVCEPYTKGRYGSGVVNATELFEFEAIAEPTFSHNERQYNGTVSLEIYAEDGAEIYYTTNGTYPSPTNGMRYTKPYVFNNADIRFRAVAYKNGLRSRCVTKDIAAMVIGTDDMFTITEDGVITDYSGAVNYLKIPEYVNGIKVVDLQYEAFQTDMLFGVVMPDTVEYLGWTDDDFDRVITEDAQLGCFNSCTNLEYIWGYNVKALGYYALQGLNNLKEIFFPNCEEIYPSAFYWSFFVGANFPKVKRVGYRAFQMTYNLREVYLPECEEISYRAFDMSGHRNSTGDLRYIYAPKANLMTDVIFVDEEYYTVDSAEATCNLFDGSANMTYIDLPAMESLGTDAFRNSAINRLDLSSVQYLYSLPNILYTATGKPHYSNYYLPVTVELCLPSTLQYCVSAADYKNEFMYYYVYGSRGTYAESWTETNDVKFIELTAETSISKDIETVWDKYSYKPLEFDARGFNRTYQWYGSMDETQGNFDDKAISGATSKTYDPGESQQYQYYYCKMTSTDKNVDGEVISTFTVNSSMCQNRYFFMYSKDDTYIDFTNNCIFTSQQGRSSVFDIVGVPSTTDHYYYPSYGCSAGFYYGTGSAFIVYTNGTQQTEYKIVVQGDVNGDSIVDVLDVADVEKTANGHATLSDCYALAADLDCNEDITAGDYQQIVNRALS